MPDGIAKLILLLSLSCAFSLAEPIKPHPANRHYFVFKGKPAILITSAEHYGLPWARSDQPGYLVGGNKFDLDRWSPYYFARLKDFLSKAADRGIVVEICFFNSQYSDTWPISPLYYENNIQGEGRCGWRDAQTLKHADLVRREDDYVRKITQEVNDFDNVILEICDEAASIGTGIALAGPWVGHLLDVVKNAERNLSKKRLIAQKVEGPFGGPMDFSADPQVSIITAQYLWGPEPDGHGGEMGGMRALDYEYGLNKPIELNETDCIRGDIAATRLPIRGWRHGNLSWALRRVQPLERTLRARGSCKSIPRERPVAGHARNLKTFMYSFDFLRMRPDQAFLVEGLHAPHTYYRAMSEPAEQYALYAHHSNERRGSYVVAPGSYREELTLRLPQGSYQADWVDPASGSVISSERFRHEGGDRSMSTPAYTVDVALRIKRMN